MIRILTSKVGVLIYSGFIETKQLGLTTVVVLWIDCM